MPKGRPATAYQVDENGVWQRRYRPECKCIECGERAMLTGHLCHDCNGELNADFLPTPEQIVAECAAIRETWDEMRYKRSGEDLTPEYTIPTCREATDHRRGGIRA